jgi:hypothetical protein
MLNMKIKLFTAFHSQINDQTERMNQIIKQYFRIYCNYQQNNWGNLLLIIKFTYNNIHQFNTECSSFYVNYELHSTFNLNLKSNLKTPSVPAAKTLTEKIQQIHDILVKNIKSIQNTQIKYYNVKHKRIEFSVDDKV